MMPLWPYPFIFLLYAAFIIPSSVICEWHTIPPAASDNSYGFESSSSSLTSHSSSGYYRCPSVVCLRTFHASKERIDPYVHFMVGTTNPSSVPLTVYRLCDLFQHCLDRNNFMITVHIAKDSSYQNSILSILQGLDVPYQIWEGNFTSTFKMLNYLNLYSWANDPNKFIYHTDLDEIPDTVHLSIALQELVSGKCDAIRALWRERATLDGKLANIDLGTQINPLVGDEGIYSDGALGLYSQYPLRCNISANFMVPFTTRKIIVYRSNMRLTSGQHDVWCDKPSKPGDPTVPWKPRPACMKHLTSIRERYDKSVPPEIIYDLLPKLVSRPRICPTQVILDHFKFVGGAAEYLKHRADSYRSKGLAWWTQSKFLSEYITKNGNGVCVKCAENHCINTLESAL